MGDENDSSRLITWRITGFTTLMGIEYFSDMFLVDQTLWTISVQPKGGRSDIGIGGRSDHLPICLKFQQSASLPSGWAIEAQFSFTVVNQYNNNLSRTKGTVHTFTSWHFWEGYDDFMSLREVHDVPGFLVDDTLVVEAKVELRRLHPPVIRIGTLHVRTIAATTPTNRFDSYFGSLERLIDDCVSPMTKESIEAPSEEVKHAKESLKECIADLLKLNVKEKLAKALSTLILYEDGLSPAQQKTVALFLANFDEFKEDFLTTKEEDSEYELQKLLKDQILREMRKNHKTHLSYKRLHGELSEEEEKLKEGLEDVNSRRAKLMADWDTLLAESEKLELKFKAQ